MARKPRNRPERETSKIEIERNVIERSLMKVKEAARKNRKLVLYAIIGLLAVLVVIIAAVVVVESVNTRNELRFEKILDDYNRYVSEKDNAKIKGVIAELKEFTGSTYFGITRAMGFYLLGNIYYDGKEYREASGFLVKYADKEPKTSLAPIALLKAAVALEEAGDLKGAKEIYGRLEDKYSDSIIADQIYFNMARMYAEMKDPVNSRNYYKKVITSYPDSVFTMEARKRLFMLGAMQP
jgi:tetratricopeptide (TPR) repeat protein